jgi:hypothetical protein
MSARVYDTFVDLHNKASNLVSSLYDGPATATPLVLEYSNRAEDYATTTIASKLGERTLSILSFSIYTPPRLSTPIPSNVSGHRSGESTGDYMLFAEGGYIACQLQGMGTRSQPEALDPREQRLLGIVDLELKTQVAELSGNTKERWDLVTKGILDSLTMVELIRDGTPTVDVFEMMGREQLVRS